VVANRTFEPVGQKCWPGLLHIFLKDKSEQQKINKCWPTFLDYFFLPQYVGAYNRANMLVHDVGPHVDQHAAKFVAAFIRINIL